MTHRENALETLRREEQLLEYLHRHQNEAGHPVLSEEELRCFFASDTERAYTQFMSFLELIHSDGEEYVLETEKCMNRQERIGVFLHPRFLPSVSHKHPHHEIKYILRGKVALSAGGRSFMMEEGDFSFIAPMVEHSCPIFDPDTLLVNIEIRPEALRTVFQQVFQTENPIASFYNVSGMKKKKIPVLLCRSGADQEVRDLVRMIYDYKAETVRPGQGEIIGEMMVEQLLILLLSRHNGDFSDGWNSIPHSHTMFEVLNFIRQNLKTVTLSSLAGHFNYSESYMSRFIKRNANLTFSDLLQNTRLDRAAELLRDTELPVASVIAEVGYTGKAHFYRIFQEKFGLTPAELRKKFR